jgi:micrococcal nuclease
MRFSWFVASIIALVIATSHAGGSVPARVAVWADGDTVTVVQAGREVGVRLIGIDGPETSRGNRAQRQSAEWRHDVATIVALGRAARSAAARLAPPHAPVRLELDVRTHDRFGRLLAYVWLADGRMVNEELLRQGFAVVYTVPPNVRYTERFLAAQDEARAEQRGLWGPR